MKLKNYLYTLLILVSLATVACSGNSQKQSQEKVVANKVAHIEIPTMHCEGCVTSISQKISQINGVGEYDVSLENLDATVHFDSTQTDTKTLVDAVTSLGYEVTVE